MDGTVLDQLGYCVFPADCPCQFNGAIFANGDVIMQRRCMQCECCSGKWKCVELNCPGWAVITAFAHVQTFDDVHYNMQGLVIIQCTF